MRVFAFATAATLLVTSSSALAQYAPPPPHAMPMPPPMEAPRRSTGMMVAGIVLTSIGSATLIGGVVSSFAFLRSSGEAGPIGFAIVSIPLMAGSTLFAGIGIPLWVVGASRPRPRYAEAIPALSLGAGCGALRWAF